MKREWQQILFSVCLTMVLPAVILNTLHRNPPAREQEPTATHAGGAATTAPSEEAALSRTVPVLEQDGSITDMELETYVTRVVLAEMPAEFEPEALKAQAVVARTYALRRNTVSQKHEKGAVCTDYRCCQAYRTEEDFLSSGESQSALDKVRAAVQTTAGEVLTYQGQLAEATYFSCSGGRTEDAAAVWGSEIPYLQAVDSPGEENASHYTDTVTFSTSDFCSKLGISESRVQIGKITYTDGGGVATIRIGGSSFTGVQMREKLGLRSTRFTVSAAGDTVTITTKGFGHRVGMSQYGADAMAVAGSSYEQILAHYYPGTEMKK